MFAPLRNRKKRRRGIIAILAAVLLAVLFAFVALTVDTGRITFTQTTLQNAADAASLAAVHELSSVIPEGSEDPNSEPSNVAQVVELARQRAVEVAAANGVTIDPNLDIIFGQRSYNESNQTWPIQWGASPHNVVKVVVRRTHEDTSRPDGKLPLAFGWAVGRDTADVIGSASAFVESREIVLVLDFSGSMSYDSQFRPETIAKLGQPALEANLANIWADLGSPTYGNLQFEPQYVTVTKAPGSVTWPGQSVSVTFAQNVTNVRLTFSNGSTEFFSGGTAGMTKTFQGTGTNTNRLITQVRLTVAGINTTYDFSSNTEIRNGLGLANVPYPYPSGSWSSYIDYARNNADIAAAGFQRKFGMKTLVEYWLKNQASYAKTPDLWKTRHYPFHAVKEGASLFCELLNRMGYGDRLGLVTYDTTSRIEYQLNNPGMPFVHLGTEWLTDNYSDIDTIQRHKQASHYGSTTNIGGGLNDAITLLREHGRYGARPTIILMTDGNANVRDPNWIPPANWNWNELTDYDGDGQANYSTTDPNAFYAIGKAKEAADLDITVHCMTVGANADDDLLEAIAHIGGGTYIEVPGGSSVSQMEAEVRAAFEEIAAKLPPPRLVYDQ